MAKGNILESIVNRISKVYSKDLILHRIKDGYDYGSYNRSKSICDYFGHCHGFPLLIEAKETEKEKFYVSDLKRREHQLKALRAWAQSHQRATSGYLFLFKRQQRIAFLPIQYFPILLKTIDLDTPGIRSDNILGTDWEYLFCGEIFSKRRQMHSDG